MSILGASEDDKDQVIENDTAADGATDKQAIGEQEGGKADEHMNVDFLSEESPSTTPERDGKRKLLGTLLIGVSVAALVGLFMLPGSDEAPEDDLGSLYSDGAAKEPVVDTYVGQEGFDEENLSDNGEAIIKGVQEGDDKQYQIPVIERADGKMTTNGKVRIEETKRTVVDHEQKGDAATTQKSFVEERRDLGMELDQRLNDAKINNGLVVSKGGAPSWARGEIEEGASSSGRILIIGGDVKATDRTVDTEAAEIGSTSVEFDIGAAEEKSITDVVGGVAGAFKGGVRGIITEGIKEGVKGSLPGN